MSEHEREPDEEELARAMAEQLRRMRVEDLIASTLQTLLALGYQRLGPGAGRENVTQVELAIEAIRGLLPVAERFLPPEALVPFRQALAELQLGYASAAREAGVETRAPAAGQAPPAGGAPP